MRDQEQCAFRYRAIPSDNVTRGAVYLCVLRDGHDGDHETALRTFPPDTAHRAVPREEITLDAVKARRATDGLTRAWTTASERDIDWLLAAHQALTRERDAAVELSRIATLEHCRAENELTDFVDMHTSPSRAVPDEEPTLGGGAAPQLDDEGLLDVPAFASWLLREWEEDGAIATNSPGEKYTILAVDYLALRRDTDAIARELGVEPTFDLATHLRGALATRDAWVDQSAELSALRSESEALQRDKERLDWLDKRIEPLASPDGEDHIGNAWGVYGPCYTVRDAIDEELRLAAKRAENPDAF